MMKKAETDLCKLWISLFIHFNCVLATVKAEMPNVSLYKLFKKSSTVQTYIQQHIWKYNVLHNI